MIKIAKTVATVWSVEDKSTYVKVRLSTRSDKKDRNGDYVFSSWFCSFVGNSVAEAKLLKERDTITLESGRVECVYDKAANKSWTSALIFGFSMGINLSEAPAYQPPAKADTPTEGTGFHPVDDDDEDDELPF